MTQRSRFYDSSGGDRIYGSEAWAQIVQRLIGDGVVVDFANEFAVHESSPAAMSVRVNLGAIFVQGYLLEVYASQETLVIGANVSGQPRIDRIVARRSLAGRTGLLAVLAGTPAASPVPPTLTQDVAAEYEVSLAQVLVAAGAASIVNADITDERTFAQGPDVAAIVDTSTGHDHDGSDSKAIAHSATTGQTATDHHAAAVAGPDADVTIDSAGAAGTASTFARSAHGHKVSTTDAPSGANVAIDAAATPAAGGSIARAGHGHRVDTTAGPGGDVTVDVAGAAGATGALARVTHGHKLVTSAATPVRAGTGGAGTSGTAPSRGDHRHPREINTYTASSDADLVLSTSDQDLPLVGQNVFTPAVIEYVSAFAYFDMEVSGAGAGGLTCSIVSDAGDPGNFSVYDEAVIYHGTTLYRAPVAGYAMIICPAGVEVTIKLWARKSAAGGTAKALTDSKLILFRRPQS